MYMIRNNTDLIDRKTVLSRNSQPVLPQRPAQPRRKHSPSLPGGKDQVEVQIETRMRSSKNYRLLSAVTKDWRQKPGCIAVVLCL